MNIKSGVFLFIEVKMDDSKNYRWSEQEQDNEIVEVEVFLWSVQMLCPKNIAYHHGFYHVVKRIKCKIRFTEITFKESKCHNDVYILN